MPYLISFAIWTVDIVLTILVYLAVLVCSILFYFSDPKRKLAHAQCFWWADILMWINPFWKFTVRGLENIDPKRTYVIVANHQSLADIVVLYKTRMQFKWIAKASLFQIPFIGWSLTMAKHIRLERGELGSIKQVYRQAAEWLRRDMSVLLFPEGTRRYTDKMNVFQNGAFKLAIKEKVPVLPISIRGTREAIPKGGWVFSTHVHVRLTVLPAIETAFTGAAEFAQLRDRVYGDLERLHNGPDA